MTGSQERITGGTIPQVYVEKGRVKLQTNNLMYVCTNVCESGTICEAL